MGYSVFPLVIVIYITDEFIVESFHALVMSVEICESVLLNSEYCSEFDINV